MEASFLILVTIFLSISISFLLARKKSRLPPGPLALPWLGNPLWLRATVFDITSVLQRVHRKYGPIVTLQLGARTAIFISDRDMAHKALVTLGAAFSDRPTPNPATSFLHSDEQYTITGGAYGPVWRLFRRNLNSEILHPSRMKLFGPGREWVLGLLKKRMYDQLRSSDEGVVVPYDIFLFAQFSLLFLICFGEKLDEGFIRKFEGPIRQLLIYERDLEFLAFFPAFSKLIYRSRWKWAVDTARKLEELCSPLLEARRNYKKNGGENQEIRSYVDSLLELKLPGKDRGLTDSEIMTLTGEIMTSGTDTTSASLQWTMANLVRNQDVQKKLHEEIESVSGGESVEEEELQRMPYLRAVVLESLRRHPPGHLVLPHAVKEDMEFEGYVIPKNVPVNFSVADMGWDETVWEEPKEFKPERFFGREHEEVVDMTGSREIKMMPFGAGRRICPGMELAMLHLQFFVANMVKEFEWKQVEGEDVDLTEKLEYTVVMKNPLRVRLVPRKKV
ncbi:cytochrome P450 89A2-like isoform X1 [Iris pallida]|uniref:Cytochrome P450 89A2-like isoform X1 n=1 Tax=Iris pallida TaxID=29817 RepID=A0AAX6IEA0_IRIPA|nr:cytochrome P450 89A2-like isoform X1 [Iris pallida]